MRSGTLKKFLKNSHVLKAKLQEKVSITVDGHTLSSDDNYRVICSMVYLAAVIYDLKRSKVFEMNRHLSRQLSGVPILLKIGTLLHDEDFAYVQDQFKCMLLSIRNIPGKGISRRSAKAHLKAHGVDSIRHRNGSNGLLMDVREMCLYLLCCDDEQQRIMLFKAVNTIVQFTTRLTLHDVDWITENEVIKYLDLETAMKTWQYDQNIVQELNAIMKEWLSDIDLITDNPTDSHGYGATRDVRRSAGTACKWRSMEQNSSTEHLLAAQLLGIVDHELVERTTCKWAARQLLGLPIPEELLPENRYSVFQFVPKGINKKRGVSMEDTPNQYYQKIVFDRLDKHLQKHPEIGIHLHEQEVNRDLSRLGSATGTYGTIDLSSASDTVTWTLVQGIFKDTKVLPVMKLLRTPICKLKDAGVSVTLEKAFPMGSAICFPIESLTFAAVCELANRHMGVHRNYLVYGDDMVVHLDTADEVVRLLQLLHFEVNTDKSYLPGSAFTESCGGEYYHFYDVSPLRLSRKIDFVVKYRCNKHGTRSSNKESLCENLRDLYNKAYKLRYKNLCSLLLQDGLELNPYLYFSVTDEGWLSENPTNMHLEHRYIADEDEISTKGWQIRTRIMRSRIRHDKNAEALRLERWFESRGVQQRRIDSNRCIVTMRPENITRLYTEEGCMSNVGSAYTTWKWDWLPDPGLYKGQIPYA